jgi:hypothetical protein
MLEVRWILVLAFVSLALACKSSTPREPEPVYRYINVVGGSQIRLGERFDRFDLSDRVDDSSFVLRPGTFGGGGTQAILARTDTKGIVRGLIFIYDGSESLETKIRDYTASLGAPLEAVTESNGKSLYVWQDSSTRFELHFAPREQPAFWSRLTDRRRS